MCTRRIDKLQAFAPADENGSPRYLRILRNFIVTRARQVTILARVEALLIALRAISCTPRERKSLIIGGSIAVLEAASRFDIWLFPGKYQTRFPGK